MRGERTAHFDPRRRRSPSDAAGGYTVFGEVTDGLAIVEGVAEAGTLSGGSDGAPAEPVVLNEVTVS